MAAVSKADAAAVFDLKSAALTLVALQPKTADLNVLAQELERRLGDSPVFDGDPVAIDFSQLPDESIDVPALVALLRRYRMHPIAAKGGNAGLMQAAQAAGLSEAADTSRPAESATRQPAQVVEVATAPTTLVVDKPLRSGQQVYARGGDLVVLAVVSYGAEVIADGNIHVYAPLRGRAIAGAKGRTDARIYTLGLEAQLVAIAGTYRTIETPLPAEVHGKPAQVRFDGERLVIEPLGL